ncbi:hypothetical protein FCV25MIE_19601 [Fagus crenata]
MYWSEHRVSQFFGSIIGTGVTIVTSKVKHIGGMQWSGVERFRRKKGGKGWRDVSKSDEKADRLLDVDLLENEVCFPGGSQKCSQKENCLD